jgi:hypothetical protein
MRNIVIGLVLLVVGIGLVLMGATCPCLSLLGTVLVFVLGIILTFTALAALVGWTHVKRAIDAGMNVFEKIRGWVIPSART